MKKVRKSLSLLLAFVILFSCFPGRMINAEEISTKVDSRRESADAKEWSEEDFFFEGVSFSKLTAKGKAKLKANNGVLYFPSLKTSHGNPICGIKQSGFTNLGIKSVGFSDQITEIGGQAFYGNNIEELNLPNTIKEIGFAAFKKNEIKSLTLPDSLVEIAASSFAENNISDVVVPDSVTKIFKDAFDKSTNLHISQVDKIEFQNCKKEDFTITAKASDKSAKYTEEDFTVRERAREEEGLVITGLSSQGQEKRKTSHVLNIPSVIDGKKVKIIGKSAFFNRSTDDASISFEEVILPSYLEKIEDGAFAGNSISKIDFPDSLKVIEQNSFCFNKLESLRIPNSVEKVGLHSFAYNKLKNVEIDNTKGKVSIDSMAFDDQEGGGLVKFIYLRDAKKNVDKYKINFNLDKGVTLSTSPANEAKEGEKVSLSYKITDDTKEILKVSVKKGQYFNLPIKDNSFIMPSADVTIEIKLKDKYSLDKWCAEDFIYYTYDPDPDNEDAQAYYCLKGLSEKGIKKLENNKNLVLPEKDPNGYKPVWVEEDAFKDKNIESVEIPGNYTHIQSRAFKNCGIKNLKLHDGLLYVQDSAFENNELTNLTLPETFKYPSKSAFKGNKLTSLVLPNSCTSIGPSSFMDNQIASLTLGNKTDRIWAEAFKNNKIKEVNIPLSLKKGCIERDAFDGNIGKENPLKKGENKVILWTPQKNNPNNIKAGNNYIVDPKQAEKQTVEFVASDFSYEKDKVSDFSKEGLKKYKKLGEDVTLKLPEVDTKGKKVTGVADYAFSDIDPQIKKIVIPNGYETIGEQAFSSSGLTEIELPDSMLYIEGNAFLNYEQITVKCYVSSDKIKETIGDSGNFWEVIVRNTSSEPSKPDKHESEWTAEDFKYKEMPIKYEENNVETTVNLNAVAGFSEAGLKKSKTLKKLVLPSEDTKGKKVEAITDLAFMGAYGKKGITGDLSIPEGYKYIGQMAFAFNNISGEVKLPDSLLGLGESVFFRNEITSLIVPKGITEIPAVLMRGNKLNKVEFKGDIEAISDLAFAENNLEEIIVPDSLKTIGKQAFETNTGSDAYKGKLVIRTKSGKNPNNLKNKENYIIDPKNPGQGPSLDYTKWTQEDFTYKKDKLEGFSDQGLLKIRKNKNLVIPAKTPDGQDLKVIGIDAFRNLNQGFDIKSVEIPDTVVKIEDYALQFNEISKVKLPRDLKTLGMGVFMSNFDLKVEFNDKLEYIDQACFYETDLGSIELPASVNTIMDAAFRKSNLNEVKFKEGSKLKEIKYLGFADNNLKDIKLPEGLEVIGNQAFGNNKFTELNMPSTLKVLGFQAFANNPSEANPKAVVINIDNNNIHDDEGKTFIVNPKVLATEADKAELKNQIDLAEKVDKNKLTKEFKGYFENALKEAKSISEDSKASKASVAGATKEMKFANKRSEINTLMFEKELLDSKAQKFDKEKWQQVEISYNRAKEKLMVINISDQAVEQLISDLDLALKNLSGVENPLEGAIELEGEAEVKRTHYIEPYTIKVKVWVKEGKIIHVIDNKTVHDDPSEDEEHNGGYFKQALPIMRSYIGKSVEEVLGHQLGKKLGIDSISGATVSSRIIHKAIQNALSKYKKPEVPNEDINPGEVKPGEEKHDNIPVYFGIISSSSSSSSSQSENKKEIEKKEEPQKDYENHWAKEAIDLCLEKGYFKDIVDKSNFNPEKAATRAEFITVLARYAGINNKTNKAGFEDVSSDKYYSPFISWAKENKIILGRGNGKFAPDATISRAEMATIIHRMAKVLKLDKSTKNMNIDFKDADAIPNWAKDAVKDLVNLGIINGNNDNTFNPKGNFKRAELAQIIYNFSKNK
ncbi:leucine-rich repeat protein [Peptoniphilus sp. GNH]|nr:leucine-rich repeat protein [Peptoniphilus sp. GNH]